MALEANKAEKSRLLDDGRWYLITGSNRFCGWGSAIILMARSSLMPTGARLKIYSATQPLAIKMMALPEPLRTLACGRIR